MTVQPPSMPGTFGPPAPSEWPWLGALRRSISYGADDGSDDGTAASNLSDADRKFLDRVLSNGTASEMERMRSILVELTDRLAGLHENVVEGDIQNHEEIKDVEMAEADHPREGEEMSKTVERMVELLLRLRDLVHLRVDFSRAFVALGGIEFLLGCACERNVVPRPVRSTALFCLDVLCEENPPIQYALLTHGSIQVLAGLYFAEFPTTREGYAKEFEEERDGLLRGRIVQALHSSVTGHRAAEHLFCKNELAVRVIERGLGVPHAGDNGEACPASLPVMLRRRSLEFLSDLLLSPHATAMRAQLFAPSLDRVIDALLVPEAEPSRPIREAALTMIRRVLQRGGGFADAILPHRDAIESFGRKRVWEISATDMKGSPVKSDGINGAAMSPDREGAERELTLWMKLAAEIANSTNSSS